MTHKFFQELSQEEQNSILKKIRNDHTELLQVPTRFNFKMDYEFLKLSVINNPNTFRYITSLCQAYGYATQEQYDELYKIAHPDLVINGQTTFNANNIEENNIKKELKDLDAYIYCEGDVNSDNKFWLITSEGEILASHFCSNIRFAYHDLWTNRKELQQKLIDQGYKIQIHIVDQIGTLPCKVKQTIYNL